MSGTAEGILRAFLEGGMTFMVYAAIVVIFILCIAKCVFPVLRVRALLRRAVKSIRQGEGGSRSWQDEGFLGGGALYPHWREYLNNLFFADGEFHNPSNVEDYINADSAVYGPGNARFAEIAPGVMVSLGFLGTLIGISAGLRGFSMDDAEQVMSAIRQLVPGMQYAFTTSIVGVVASILTTLITRAADESALRQLDGFYAAMSRYAGVASVDPMTQIAIYQQEQTALLQSMAKELSGGLSDRLAAALDKPLREMESGLSDFMQSATREQVKGVDMIVKRFIQQMNLQVDGQFQNLEKTLRDTSDNQRMMNEAARKGMESLLRVSQNLGQSASLTDSMLGKMDAFLEKLTAAQRASEESYARISSNVEHMDLVARQQNACLQSLTHLQDEVAKSLSDFTTVSGRFMDLFSEESGKAAGALDGATKALKQSADLLAANHKALVKGVSNDIDHSFNTFFKAVEDSTQRVSWILEDVQKTVSALPSAVDGASEMYARQAERLSDALLRSRDALDDAVDRLTQAVYGGR